MTVLPFLQVTHHTAAKEIQRLARDSSKVQITRHAIERMAERDVVRRQVDECLRNGKEQDYSYDYQHQSHKVKFGTTVAGRWVEVVAALVEQSDGSRVVVVTVIANE